MSAAKSRLVFGFLAVTSGLSTWLCWNLLRAERVLSLLAVLAPAGVIVFGAAALYPELLRQLEKDFEYAQLHNRMDPNPTPEARKLRRLFAVTWVGGLVAGVIHWVLLMRW